MTQKVRDTIIPSRLMFHSAALPQDTLHFFAFIARSGKFMSEWYGNSSQSNQS